MGGAALAVTLLVATGCVSDSRRPRVAEPETASFAYTGDMGHTR